MSIVYNPASDYALCGDLGGTNFRAAIVERTGKLMARHVIPSNPEQPIERAGQCWAAVGRQLAQEIGITDVAGISVASAGPMRPWDGVYIFPPNLKPWHGKSLKPILEDEFGMPVIMGHDATLSAYGETVFGPHKGCQNVVYITVSTGVGGGIVTNGKMVIGAHGIAGEAGHLIVRPGGRQCNVGCNGCFEGNACGPAVVALAQDALEKYPDSVLLAITGGNKESLTAAQVFQAAQQGDKAAQEVTDYVIETIGMGVASLLNLLDPEVIYLGGGVITGLEPLWEQVQRSARKYALPRYRDTVPVEITTLGDDAGILGAAAVLFTQNKKVKA